MKVVRDGTIRPSAEDARAAVVEFGLTTAFMAVVFSLVRWGIGTSTPGAAELRLRVVVVSALVGLVIVGFAVSRPGRFSGAHMNPAITVGLYAFGAVPARRVLPYLAAQATGSVAAAMVTRLLWGPAVAEKPVSWAVVQPGRDWNWPSVAVAEAATLAIIVAVMCWVTTHRHRWPLAWIVGGLFGLQGAILGTLTGGSANPARQLGPALFSGEFHLLAVYLVAPVVGGLLAGWVAGQVEPGGRFRDLRVVLRGVMKRSHGLASASMSPSERDFGPERAGPSSLPSAVWLDGDSLATAERVRRQGSDCDGETDATVGCGARRCGRRRAVAGTGLRA